MRRLILLILCSGVWCVSAANDLNASITLKGTFTTNTRFLYHLERTEYYDPGRVISSNLGYGADVRWNIMWERFYLGFSVEKIRAVETVPMIDSRRPFLRIPVEEGFDVVAVELSGYYVVPISSDNVQFYLGGGFGAYDGERLYSVANVRAATVRSTSNIGIHVLTGIDYRFFSHVALRGELKFRDPHFDVTNKFDQPFAMYEGYRIPLDQSETTSRVNLYGVNYMLGVVVYL